MRYYEISAPENEQWCVPATLQALLKSRGIEITQSRIASHFSPVYVDSSFDGFTFSNESFNRFLQGFSLDCGFRNPHESIEFYEECDIFLREIFDRGDVILSYDLPGIQKRKNGLQGHISLIREFDSQSRTVTLADSVLDGKSFPLGEFVVNMSPWDNKNHGFYVVSEK